MLEALRGGSVLETLDLGANGLTGAGFEQLLPQLAACPGLKTLEVIHRKKAILSCAKPVTVISCHSAGTSFAPEDRFSPGPHRVSANCIMY